jgi:hypothetical protein
VLQSTVCSAVADDGACVPLFDSYLHALTSLGVLAYARPAMPGLLNRAVWWLMAGDA